MTVIFDTLSCAKRLSEAGENPEIAEAHAMVLKDFATTTLPGKGDIRHLHEEMENVREEIEDLRCELKDACCEMREFRQEVSQRFTGQAELSHEIGLLRRDIEALVRKLTVRLSGIVVLAAGAAAALGRVV